MRVVIFARMRPNKKLEMEVDPMADEVGHISDHDYIIKNMGNGKKILVDHPVLTAANIFHAYAHGQQKDQ